MAIYAIIVICFLIVLFLGIEAAGEAIEKSKDDDNSTPEPPMKSDGDEYRACDCKNCGHRMNFLLGTEGENALCPKCGFEQLLWAENDIFGEENEPSINSASTLFIPFIRGVGSSLSDQLDLSDGRTGQSATGDVANDLITTVSKYESKGYEFQRIETVHVDVSPGCIGMLMGKGKEYHPYDYLVFRKLPQPMSEGAAMLNS